MSNKDLFQKTNNMSTPLKLRENKLDEQDKMQMEMKSRDARVKNVNKRFDEFNSSAFQDKLKKFDKLDKKREAERKSLLDPNHELTEQDIRRLRGEQLVEGTRKGYNITTSSAKIVAPVTANNSNRKDKHSSKMR